MIACSTKLSSYGTDSSVHSWLSCFLRDCSMQVIVEGTTSASTTVDCGVPQETMPGLLMFLCCIKNLPEAVKSQVRLFADDCLIYREFTDTSDHNTLQEDLKSLESWAKQWGMQFNTINCYIRSLAQSPPSSFFYSLNDTIVKKVSTNPYLGIQISNNLIQGLEE